MSTAATRSSGNGATPPGRKPVASSTCAALATAARRAPMMRATFPVSAFRSPGTSATTGASSQTRTRDLTIWDERAPDRVRRPLGRRGLLRELLEPCLGPDLTEEGGDALDGLRPHP